MIHEVIVTTRNSSGADQIAPMGVVWQGEQVVIAPFRPSRTLDYLLSGRCAVINYCDDVRVFAGCLTRHYDWPMVEAEKVPAPRLAGALAYTEVTLQRIEEDPLRPRLFCSPVHEANIRPFRGFNRAQAAVLELAILVSRLDRLSEDKIAREIDYLSIALDKTAGTNERQAWDWLMERVNNFYQQRQGAAQ